MSTPLEAPFPWFGGKSRVADVVWGALGDCPGYVEPFAGSLAVLLGRPTAPGVETVNDKDAYLANLWRAIKADPEGVCREADYPVSEVDLFARHLWLVNTGRERLESLEADPEFFDVRVAGWWLWGICAWIGSGWCSGMGPWKLPHLGDAGRGVSRRLPSISGAGSGVNRKLPSISGAGAGVNRKLPPTAVREWLDALAVRLRRVRICCGDWSRMTGAVLRAGGPPTGVFLDPPYETSGDVYGAVQDGLTHAVRDWAVENGENRDLRIVLAGYDGEFDMPDSWRVHRVTGPSGYGTTENKNRYRERLWFSPGCLQPNALRTLWPSNKER